MINCDKRFVIAASKVVNIKAAKNSNENPIFILKHLSIFQSVPSQSHPPRSSCKHGCFYKISLGCHEIN